MRSLNQRPSPVLGLVGSIPGRCGIFVRMPDGSLETVACLLVRAVDLGGRVDAPSRWTATIPGNWGVCAETPMIALAGASVAWQRRNSPLVPPPGRLDRESS